MAISESDYKRGKNKRSDTIEEWGFRNRSNRSARYTSPEGYLEDEEDYEEFARSMDRKRAGAKSGGRNSGTSGRSSAGEGGRSGSGRNGSSERYRSSGRYEDSGWSAGDSFREAGDFSGEPVGAGAGEAGKRSSSKQGNQEEIRLNGSENQKKETHRRKGGVLKVILIFLLIMVIIAGAAAGFVFYKMRNVLKLQRVNSVNLEEQLRPGIPYKVLNDDKMEGYRNIALFGVDSRTGDLLGGDNRSDTMMICSINEKTGDIRLVSIYRDTLLDVGGGELRKANTAYALGGPAQAIDMLNKNFDMNIVDFVTVGFEGLAKTIDALGGIEIEIDEEERGYLNQYVHDMHVELGTENIPVENSGLVTLNGIQATAYSRIRYTAGDDFRRAERQRTVLDKTLEKARSASPATLVGVADNVMEDIATSLSSTEILGLIVKAGDINLVDTLGLPMEEYRTFGSSYEEGDYVLPLNLEDNVKYLHHFLFGEEQYELSDEAMERNTAIMNSGGYNDQYYY